MGCGDECPYVPGLRRRDDWPLEDPNGQPIERVRMIRDDIRTLEAVADWHARTIGRAEAVDRIAKRFREWAAIFEHVSVR